MLAAYPYRSNTERETRLGVETHILITVCLRRSPELHWQAETDLSPKLTGRRTAAQCTVDQTEALQEDSTVNLTFRYQMLTSCRVAVWF